DRSVLLLNRDLLPLPNSIVVEIHGYVPWVPRGNIAYPKIIDVVPRRLRGTNVRLERYDCSRSMLEARPCNILSELTSALIDVGLDLQTILKSTVHVLEVTPLVVGSDVPNIDTGDVDPEPGVDRRDDGAFVGI